MAVERQVLPWLPWEHSEAVIDANGRVVRLPEGYTSHYCGRYHVIKREMYEEGPRHMTWLSIKRADRAPIHDWRDLQRIKNELCGPEREAMEIYPAESRKVDGANQYHLWVMATGVTIPVGFKERLVTTPELNKADPDPHIAKAEQRPFDPDDPWNQATTPVELVGMIQTLIEKNH